MVRENLSARQKLGDVERFDLKQLQKSYTEVQINVSFL